MIQSTKSIHFLFFILLLFLFSCHSESKVFVGEWEDARDSTISWKISKSGSSFTGERLTGQDTYNYDTEEWTFEIGQGENRILRTPPGRTYVKIVK